jgi:hypothetical protein
MPSSTVTPGSDITTTGWSSTQAHFYSVLAANNGTDYVENTGGASNPLVMGTTFNVSGIASITSVSYSVQWLDGSKSSDVDFEIQLWKSGLGTKLADMTPFQTGSTSAITSTGSLTINDSTVADWANLSIKLLTDQHSGDVTSAQFYGLSLTINYTTAGGGQGSLMLLGCGH